MTRRCRSLWPDRGRGVPILFLPASRLYLSEHIMFELLLSHFVRCISRFVCENVKYFTVCNFIGFFTFHQFFRARRVCSTDSKPYVLELYTGKSWRCRCVPCVCGRVTRDGCVLCDLVSRVCVSCHARVSCVWGVRVRGCAAYRTNRDHY